MELLAGLRVVEIGPGLAAAACGRLFADLGARVSKVGRRDSTALLDHLDHAKTLIDDIASEPGAIALAAADLIVCEGSPSILASRGIDAASLRTRDADAAIALISPFGQSGPRANEPACDLTLFAASGIARMLTGQVDDLGEPPMRPVGEQSSFIGGIAAACAGMHAVLSSQPAAVLDISIQEALATLAMTELARAGLTGKGWSRRRESDGNGATVTILPARDGFAAISPREEHQWKAWLAAMGDPAWGGDPRFARKPDRVKNWDMLHGLMSGWSRQLDKRAIADLAQAAHVPSFPLLEPTEQLGSEQLEHRSFYRTRTISGQTIKVPGTPFGLTIADAGGSAKAGNEASAPSSDSALPLAGLRVLDFSWVIAGPTTTRYLAAMGADVIKVEAPGAGDPGRASELHTVLGQGKRSIVLDLKSPPAVEVGRALAARCDVLIENFATGVMDRLGLGADDLRRLNPGLIYVSASGLGRTGPEAKAVAYGTLLQSYAGFAGLNRHSDRPPRIGMAWLDPMCGLLLGFITAAAIWHRRRHGGAARVDFSMIEAMLWTMAEPLLETQLGSLPMPRGNNSDLHVPHGVFRCSGNDSWIAVAARSVEEWRQLCRLVPGLSGMTSFDLSQRKTSQSTINQTLADWSRRQRAHDAVGALVAAGVAAAGISNSLDLLKCEHLRQRGFWDPLSGGALPGLPWHASFGRHTGTAPGLGEHTDAVLEDVLGRSADEIAALREAGAFG